MCNCTPFKSVCLTAIDSRACVAGLPCSSAFACVRRRCRIRTHSREAGDGNSVRRSQAHGRLRAGWPDWCRAGGSVGQTSTIGSNHPVKGSKHCVSKPSLLAARPSVVHANQSSKTCVSYQVLMQPSTDTDITTAALTLQRRRRRSEGGPAARHERPIEKLCIRHAVMWLATTAEIWVWYCQTAAVRVRLAHWCCVHTDPMPQMQTKTSMKYLVADLDCWRHFAQRVACRESVAPAAAAEVHTDQHLKWHTVHRRSAS